MSKIENHVDGVSEADDAIVFSVIIPTRNPRACFSDCLISLRNQRGGIRYEILVIDDGSSDTKFLPKTGPQDDHIQLHRRKQQGPASARNFGVDIAGGKYVIFLGDDIIVKDDFLEAHHRFLMAHGDNTISFGMTVLDGSLIEDGLSPILKISGLGGDDSNCVSENIDRDFRSFATCNLALRKDHLTKERFDTAFPYAAFEDIELGYRLERMGVRVKFNAKAKAIHRHSYDWQVLKKRQYELGYSLAYMLSKHPELTAEFVLPRRLRLLARILSWKMLSFMGKYHKMGIATSCKYDGYRKALHNDT